MSFWNEEDEQQQTGQTGIEDGELVTCIILDSRYPASYLKEIDERQQAENEEAEVIGRATETILPSHKEGGIELRFAVLYRDRHSDGAIMENVIKIDEDELIEPDYVCYGSLRAYPPTVVKDSRFFVPSKGYGRLNLNGRPKIVDVYPSKYEARDWKNNLDYSDYLKDEVLQKHYPEDYKRICALENRRIESWQRDIDAFAAMDEAKATGMLLSALSARYGIARLNEETDRWEYISPEKGVIFQCRVSKKKDSKFLNLEKFKYNKDNGEYDFFGKMQISPPEEDDRQFADRIIEMLERNKTLRAQKAAERNGVYTTIDDDDMPF